VTVNNVVPGSTCMPSNTSFPLTKPDTGASSVIVRVVLRVDAMRAITSAGTSNSSSRRRVASSISAAARRASSDGPSFTRSLACSARRYSSCVASSSGE
jgi:hypothetical protein